MKQLLLASAALAFSGQAFAADIPVRMPVKAPVAAPAPAFSWSGCYLGGHVGAGWGRKDISEPKEQFFQFFATANSPISVDTGTGFGGGQVGCDYQFAANWVIGAAGDFSFANIEGQAADPFFNGKSGGPITLNAKTDWLASARGRVGYAVDRWMLYAAGGPAWAHDKYSIQNLVFWGNAVNLCSNAALTVAIACNPAGSETRTGWTIGVGFEWAFANNWSGSFEFDHYDFGTGSVTLTDPNGAGGAGLVPLFGSVDVKQRIETIKLGINYRFGWGGPVSARY